jgi:hypothetical protein
LRTSSSRTCCCRPPTTAAARPACTSPDDGDVQPGDDRSARSRTQIDRDHLKGVGLVSNTATVSARRSTRPVQQLDQGRYLRQSAEALEPSAWTAPGRPAGRPPCPAVARRPRRPPPSTAPLRPDRSLQGSNPVAALETR